MEKIFLFILLIINVILAFLLIAHSVTCLRSYLIGGLDYSLYQFVGFLFIGISDMAIVKLAIKDLFNKD